MSRLAHVAARALALARDLFLAALTVLAALPLVLLPWEAAAAVGRLYGRAAYFILGIDRRAGLVNLRRAYGPSMTLERATRTVRAVFASLGQSLAEGAQFARRFKRAGRLFEELYTAEDPALERRILADPRPKVFVMGHLGSWEAGAMILALRVGEKGGAIARRIENPFLDALARRFRLLHPSQWIEKKGAVYESLARLERGESIAVLLDENGGHRGVFVDFFGRPASTRKTAALLALRTGALVIVGAAVRRPLARSLLYRMSVLEPLPGGAHPEAVRRLTQEITTVYEGWVREDPTQWRWIHWRWKTRPDGSEETYTRRDVAESFRA
jgi:Kdo2-lipid IVA lauroyltransferase/acyltransferase